MNIYVYHSKYRDTRIYSHHLLLYGTKIWPLSKSLVSHVHGFKSHAFRTIKGVHWSVLVSNIELHLKTEEQNILYTFGQCWLIMSCNSLIITLPESSTCSTCYLQTDDNLVADHEADGRLSSAKTCSRLIWHWKMFQRSEI